MRTRKVILDEYTSDELKVFEVLCDIRDLLVKEIKQSRKRKKKE